MSARRTVSRIDGALAPGEEVLCRARLHPVALAGNAWLAGAVVGVVILIVTRNELAPLTIGLLWLAALVVVLVASLPSYLRWRRTELVVTSRRMLVRIGLRAPRGLEPADVEVHRGGWGRWLDYGLVRILDVGGTVEEFHPVRAPEAVSKAVRRLASQAARARRR